MDTHPAIKGDVYNTTARKSYREPNARSKPNWRLRKSNGDFEPTGAPVCPKWNAQASGFVQNSTLFDGTGWVPDRNLHSDMIRTEYRNRFNPEKKFHKEEIPVTSGRLAKKTLVYDKE